MAKQRTKPSSGTQAGKRDALRVFVEGQSASALAQRLWAWAEMDHNLMVDLQAWAAQSQANGDPKAMKAAITDLLACTEYLDWLSVGDYARRAEKVLPLLNKVLAADPAQARALCEHALRELYKASEGADDSGGDIGGVMQALMDLLLRSLRRAPPPASWLADWFALMQADPWGLWDEKAVLKVAGSALREQYQRRAATDWQHWVATHPPVQAERAATPGMARKTGRASALGTDVLTSPQHDHERSQLRRRYLDVLKSQGDTQAVVDLMRASMTGVAEHSELVAYCETRGKLRDALHFAQAAYNRYPKDRRSENDLLRCYEHDGWADEALAIRRLQLERMPTVDYYFAALKAAQAAGRDAAAYRDELFAWAEQRETSRPAAGRAVAGTRGAPVATGRQVDTRVGWLLAEAKHEEALALVQPPNLCQSGVLRAIAAQLPKARHAEAVPLLLRVFELAMHHASTPYQGELDLVRETASRMPAQERAPWLARLRADYKAKRNFISGLDAIQGPA